MNDTKRKLAAIVFTDIVGFTKLSSKNEPAALALLEKQRDLLQPIVEKNNGDWLKEIGDGLLLTFGTTRDAVDCAIEIQHATKNIPDLGLRIGIHQGEVVFQGSDVVGDDVNIASRIEPFASTGGIAISGRVNSSLKRDPEFETKYVGTPNLKGVDQEVKVYCITSHGLPETNKSDVTAKLDSKGFRWNLKNSIGIAASTIGLLLIVNGMFLRIGFADESEVPSIAILPLDNKGAEEDEFYAYGLSTDLISDVASAGLIRVASLKEIEELGDINFKEKAKRLLVRYVAQGTIWKRDDIFQLSMELYDTKNEQVLWSERWQKDWKDIPQVRDLLSDNILKVLRVDHDNNSPAHISNPEAYEFYLKAKHKYEKPTDKDDIEIAKGFLNKAIEIDDDLVDAKNLMGKMLENNGDIEKAMTYFSAALEKSKQLKYRKGEADSYLNISGYYYRKEDLETSKLNIDKALEIYEEQNDKDGIGRAYIEYATHYWKKDDLETAVEYDKKSLALYEELGDLEGVAINLCGIGIYYSDILKDYEGALAKYERAQNIFEENGYKRHMPYSLNNMVSIELKTGNYSSAINHLNKLSRVVKELGYGDKVEQGQLDVISSVYTSMGNYKTAIMGLEKGLKVYENINAREMIAYCYAMLGMNHYLDENYQVALEYLKKSRDISSKIRVTDNDLVIELYLNLTYKHLGQELDLTKLKNLIKETESFGYTTNLFLHQLFKDKVYLENAFIALEKKAEPMSGESKRQFLDFTIPKQIMSLYGKVIS